MSERYDLIVLGTGTAGQRPAYACREAGWSVAMVELIEPGGTCANRGCDAKKPFVNAADALDALRRFDGRGVTGEPRLDWPALQRFKAGFTDPIPDRTRRDLAAAGIDLYEGRPTFTGRTGVRVGDHALEGRKVVIAVGLEPAKMEIVGEELLTTSDGFLKLDALPPRIVFVGGGYISFEYAHAAARAGAQVTILERNDRPLRAFEPELVEQVRAASDAAGVRVICNACVTAVERRGDGLAALCEQTGDAHTADLIVHGAGRRPSVDGLNLAAAGVTCDPRRGIAVDDRLRCVGNADVYAAGDCADTGLPQLTPVSSLEGRTVAHNLLHGDDRPLPRPHVPSVVFTIPPLATIGLTEADARGRGLDPLVQAGHASSWKYFRELGDAPAGFKVLIDKSSRRILGAHLFGPQAGETINLFSLAMNHGLTADELRRTPFTYPTASSTLSYMLPSGS